MKTAVTGPVLVGVFVVALLVVAVMGYRYFAGPKQGEKPQLDPHVARMYYGTGAPNPTKPGP